jgi:uncharacterized membrane protein YjjP (DUF1212 family)
MYVMTREEQQEISRLVSLSGQLLLQHGAESKLVHDLCQRLGFALGLERLELALSASAIVCTTVTPDNSVTTTTNCLEKVINMKVVMTVHSLIIAVERNVLNQKNFAKRLSKISPERYNRWLVALMVALSCACFSHFSGGLITEFIVTFFASFFGMVTRQTLALYRFNPYLNSGASAFIATLVSSSSFIYHLGDNPSVVMASSVLFVVPGFPMINALSDMLKGFTNIGVARWVDGCLQTFFVCMGIIAAMSLTGAWGWT